LEIGSRDLGHAQLGVVSWSVSRDGSSSKFEADSSIRSKVISGPKITKLGHVTFEAETSNLCRYLSNPYCRILCF